MKHVHAGLLGNFVSLHDLVKAVADRIAISDEAADACRGMNRVRTDSPLQEQLERLHIKTILAQSRAAGVLLEPLNRRAGRRPDWYDFSTGYPKLNDGVSQRGMDILIALSKTELSMWRNGQRDQQVESLISGGDLLSADSIGFEIDELISRMKLARVPHSLNPRNSPSRRGLKAAPIVIRKAAPDLAPHSAVDLKELESLTTYLSRILPVPSAPSEVASESPLSPPLASVSGTDQVLTTQADEGRAVRVDTPFTAHEAEECGERFVYAGTAVRGRRRTSVSEPAILMAHQGMPKDGTRYLVGHVWLELIRLREKKLCADLIEFDGTEFIVRSIHGDGRLNRNSLGSLLRRWKSELRLS